MSFGFFDIEATSLIEIQLAIKQNQRKAEAEIHWLRCRCYEAGYEAVAE